MATQGEPSYQPLIEELWRDDPALAWQTYDVCLDYAVSAPGTLPPAI